MTPQVQQAVRLYYLLRALGAFGYGAVMATYIQFLRSKGLTSFEIHVLVAIFYATQFLFEVPTGAFADRYGRKSAFVLSCFLMFLSKTLYVFAPSFGWCIAAEIVSGIGLTFSTGAIQSWLIDRVKTLQGDTEKHFFLRIFSLENMLRNALLAAAALICSRLAEYTPIAPWIVSAVFMFIATIFSYYLLPPDAHHPKTNLPLTKRHRSFVHQIRDGAQIVWLSPPILFIMAMGVLQSFAQQAPNINWQPFLKTFHIPERELGYAYAYMLGAQLFGSLIAPHIKRFAIRENLLLAFVQIIFGLGIACTMLNQSLVGILLFLGLYSFARGLFVPLKEAYVHWHITDSSMRATIASFEALSRHVGAIVGSLLVGFLIKRYSMATAWVVMGGILIISGIYHALKKRE